MFSVECWRKICLWRWCFSRLLNKGKGSGLYKNLGEDHAAETTNAVGLKKRQILQALKDSRMTHVTLNRGRNEKRCRRGNGQTMSGLGSHGVRAFAFVLFVSKSCFPILRYTYSVFFFFFFWLCWVFVLHRLFSSRGKWGLLSSCSMWVSFVAEHGL